MNQNNNGNTQLNDIRERQNHRTDRRNVGQSPGQVWRRKRRYRSI
jgi:hypothetical protein